MKNRKMKTHSGAKKRFTQNRLWKIGQAKGGETPYPHQQDAGPEAPVERHGSR